jgi:hypothetical protein
MECNLQIPTYSKSYAYVLWEERQDGGELQDSGLRGHGKQNIRNYGFFAVLRENGNRIGVTRRWRSAERRLGIG